MKSLLDAGAYVNEPLPNGGTALIRAVYNGNTDSMKVLIEAGADANASMCYRGDTLCYGVTALHHSDRLTPDVSGGKHLLGIKLLLRAGAKVNMYDSKGRNALTGYIDNVNVYIMEQIVLLFAAGENIQSEKVRKVILDCGFIEPLQKPNLLNITRCAIRDHLLALDQHTHLFSRVPRLGLPPALSSYLLYDQRLDDEDDDNNHDDGGIGGDQNHIVP